MEKTQTFASIFLTIAKWRKLLFKAFGIFVIIGLAISLLLPKWYKAEARIIPAETTQPFSIAAALNPLEAGAFGLGMAGADVMTYIGILKSRTVKEAAINHFQLDKLWRTPNIDIALLIIKERVKVELDDEGLIVVSVLDNNPKLASDIANFFVQQLQEVNTRLSTQSAKANRIFLEGRVADINASLTRAEDTLRSFQEKKGAYSIPEQTQALISTAADIQAQIYALEVEIQVLVNSVKPDHPELLNRRLQLGELQKTMKTLETDIPAKDRADFQIPFSKIPEVGLEYIRLLREVEKYQKILEFLYPQLEQARLEEVKNTPTVQVLDFAQPAIRKAKPSRARVTIFITLMGLILTTIYILIYERWSELRMTDAKAYLQITNSWKAIKTDLMFWRKIKKHE